MGVIYLIKNTANGKKYVGQTIQLPEKRLLQHFNSAYDDNRKTYRTCLSRAIRKYGKDCFVMGILADNVPDDKLDVVEAHYIDMYETTNPNIGYNMSEGFGENHLASDMHNAEPDEDYSENGSVVIDNISDDDVEQFLREL